MNIYNKIFNKKIYKHHPFELTEIKKRCYTDSYVVFLKSIIRQNPNDYYEKIKKAFSAKTEIKYDYDLFSFYDTLGRKREILNNINSMSESDFNEHINLCPEVNYFAAVEDVNFMSGLAFQMEKEYGDSPAFISFHKTIKWLNNLHIQALSRAQEEGPADFDFPDHSIDSLQISRSQLEYILLELRHIEEKHCLLNPEFVKRTKDIADWLENEFKKTDPILRKMFLKRDNKILTPVYCFVNNQNFWWENTENIKKMMEENG